MLLSVENFKSIERVTDVDIANLTVLAGVNSSGKSSLIQALLLLKQTLTTSTSEKLNLDGPYVYADSLLDLIHNKQPGNMRFAIRILREEFSDYQICLLGQDFLSIEISVVFRVKKNGSYDVGKFEIVWTRPYGRKQRLAVTRWPRKDVYDISDDSRELRGMEIDGYSFANFFPIYARKGKDVCDLSEVKKIRDALVDSLRRVVYIAPLRVAPVLARSYKKDVETGYVLPDGENTRFILDRMSADRDRLALVKEWLCGRFRLAKDMKVVKESGECYRVVVTTNEDVRVDLVHMGFGLSQILPIITQGCISERGTLMIVEDPDVHMHPSIQASMADFFIFLCQNRGVSVLVETHSDHFITRLRRRIAEEMVDHRMVHLIFVINDYGESVYKTIPLSEKGRLQGSMPPGFLDTRDLDFKAIIEANMK